MTELKEKLVSKISTIEDNSIIESISRAHDLEIESSGIYKTDDLEKKAIDEGVSDIDEGKYYTDQEVKAKMSSWLKK